MISSAPRQPSMIRINITAETTGLPSYHFFFDFEITVSVFLIPASSNELFVILPPPPISRLSLHPSYEDQSVH